MRPAAFLRLQASSSITRESTATLKPPSSQARSASGLTPFGVPDRATPPLWPAGGHIRRLSPFLARLTAISLTYCPTGAEPTTMGHRSRTTGWTGERCEQAKERADERTRTADLLITSVRSVVAERCMGLQTPHK